LKDVKEKVLPEVDDEWANEASEFETVEELRADLRERLSRAAAEQAAAELEGRVLDTYLDSVDVPLPAALVNDELHYRATRFAQQLAAMGVSYEQYLQATESTRDQVEGDLRAQAERAVKAQLVLEAVAEAEGMTASEEEVEAEIRRQAERVGRDPEAVRKALADGRAGVIRGDILRSKALAYLVEHASTGVDAGAGQGGGAPTAPARTPAPVPEPAAAASKEVEAASGTEAPEGDREPGGSAGVANEQE
jgi:trigger factor